MRQPLIPAGPPAATPAAWAETVGITLAAVGLGMWTHPADPFLLEAAFPWLALVPALLALRYGVVAGAASVGVLVAAWLAARHLGWLAGELPKVHFLGLLILAMICGQFCSVWQTRLRRLDYVYREIEDRLSSLTRRHYLLRLSHDRLEQDLIGRPVTLRAALAEVRRLAGAGAGEDLPGVDQLMRLLVQSCQLEVGALHRAAGGSLDPIPAARVGEPAALAADDALVRACLESGTLAHVQASGADRDGGRYLVAAPARDTQGRTVAVLVVEQMPFFSLHDENLQTLSVLLGYYADGIGRLAAARVVQELVPTCPLEFAEELVRLHRIRLATGLQTTLVALQFGGHAEHEAHAELIRRSIRDIDMVWEIRRDAGLVIVIMLPLSGRAALNGYLARIEGLLLDKFDKTLDAARVTPFVTALDEERPAVTLRLLLEHCGVRL